VGIGAPLHGELQVQKVGPQPKKTTAVASTRSGAQKERRQKKKKAKWMLREEFGDRTGIT